MLTCFKISNTFEAKPKHFIYLFIFATCILHRLKLHFIAICSCRCYKFLASFLNEIAKKLDYVRTNLFIFIFRDPTSVFWKQNRLKTFNNWPFKTSDKCNAKSMAAAGFYVIGNIDEPDLVECFICSKQLNGWEPNDDPWSVNNGYNKTISLSLLLYIIIFFFVTSILKF